MFGKSAYAIIKKIKKIIPVDDSDYNLLPREVWLEKTLRELPDGCRILDAGAGELKYKKYCGHLDYVSQDFGQYTGQGNGAGLQAGSWDNSKLDIVSDITSIPEPDASFDAVMCVEVLEHLPEPLKALDEFFRLLRPGGRLILTAPFCAFTHFAPYFFGTGFSPYWYQEHLSHRGFTIRELTPNGNFPSFLEQEIRRIPDMAQRYSQTTLTVRDRLGLRLVRSLLARLRKSDKTSQEFTCFGYHLVAEKSV